MKSHIAFLGTLITVFVAVMLGIFLNNGTKTIDLMGKQNREVSLQDLRWVETSSDPLVDQDGSLFYQVGREPVSLCFRCAVVQAAFSPDGEALGYQTESFDVSNTQLVFFIPQTGERTVIMETSSKAITSLVWSADGKQLGYIVQEVPSNITPDESNPLISIQAYDIEQKKIHIIIETRDVPQPFTSATLFPYPSSPDWIVEFQTESEGERQYSFFHVKAKGSRQLLNTATMTPGVHMVEYDTKRNEVVTFSGNQVTRIATDGTNRNSASLPVRVDLFTVSLAPSGNVLIYRRPEKDFLIVAADFTVSGPWKIPHRFYTEPTGLSWINEAFALYQTDFQVFLMNMQNGFEQEVTKLFDPDDVDYLDGVRAMFASIVSRNDSSPQNTSTNVIRGPYPKDADGCTVIDLRGRLPTAHDPVARTYTWLIEHPADEACVRQTPPTITETVKETKNEKILGTNSWEYDIFYE